MIYLFGYFMKYVLDTHAHTIASGHFTTDTVTDLARAAKERGLLLFCVTDHSPSIPGSANENYFRSLKYCERERMGVQILYGAEVDVMENGKLGLSDDLIDEMQIVIVSQHPPCFKPKSAEENTAALISAIRRARADIVGHPDDEKYPLLPKDLVCACAQTGTAIEMNNASLTPGGYRGDAANRDRELLRLCRKFDVFVSLGSDSHGGHQIGDFTYAQKLIEEENFPQELILNTSVQKFLSHLQSHGRRL